MFRGTMSGTQHNDVVFPNGQMAFFDENLESAVGPNLLGTEWLRESQDFAVLNP